MQILLRLNETVWTYIGNNYVLCIIASTWGTQQYTFQLPHCIRDLFVFRFFRRFLRSSHVLINRISDAENVIKGELSGAEDHHYEDGQAEAGLEIVQDQIHPFWQQLVRHRSQG